MDAGCDVLAIDDEAVVCDAVRRILESRGFRVATAPDAAAGLAHPQLATCRLVLCDIMLPDGDGMQVARVLRQRRPGLPVVLMTGFATADHEAAAAAAGAVAFLAKPFEAAELLAVVRQALKET